ncbi:MAG: type III PLP-dependent enzyme [Spirochaetaceae bacterium]|nr:MAG: type III PLP-dependent enzyme [Spirochaetaceae bacterium]
MLLRLSTATLWRYTVEIVNTIDETYYFPLDRYIDPERMSRIRDFAQGRETPFLVVDLDLIRERYKLFQKTMPFAKVYYAVKANPMDEVIEVLRDLGSSFDVATRYELDQLLRLGVDPSRMSYGNTIKKRSDIAYFFEKGVRVFCSDSFEDTQNIADHAPGSRVFFRLITEGSGSDWPLSRKFGAHSDVIYNLALRARDLGLVPWGLSFHVGSQQRDIGQYDDGISRAKYLFTCLRDEGIQLSMINIGGGFPANYVDPTLPMETYASEIKRFLHEDFGDVLPEVLIEPGRGMTADAGVIVSEIVLIAKKSKNGLYRWVYLDVGMFGGLIETFNEAIRYPIYFDKAGKSEEIILAGPTCDSMDILYQNYRYRMPHSCRIGDRAYVFSTGAYTQSYSSVNFNGFPPLEAYVLPPEAQPAAAVS